MNLIPTGDAALIVGAMDDLWETIGSYGAQGHVTIVKEPIVTVTSMTGNYVPGFGLTYNESNTTVTPESQTFDCLTVEKNPDNRAGAITTNIEPQQIVYLKVKQIARDYIRDGRKTLHAIHEGRKYNVSSDEEVVHMLSNTYYIFKLELIT